MKTTRTFLQNKLWRDKAIERMERHGSKMIWRSLNDEEFDTEIRVKLLEEAQEVTASSSRDELISELADVYEVIEAIIRLHSITVDEIRIIKEKKQQERGGFAKRIFVMKAECPIGSFGDFYFSADPDKYPEI